MCKKNTDVKTTYTIYHYTNHNQAEISLIKDTNVKRKNDKTSIRNESTTNASCYPIKPEIRKAYTNCKPNLPGADNLSQNNPLLSRIT